MLKKQCFEPFLSFLRVLSEILIHSMVCLIIKTRTKNVSMLKVLDSTNLELITINILLVDLSMYHFST